MRKTTVAMAALATALVSGAAWAYSIVGSAHDLSATGPNGGLGITEVCLPCHAPHNGPNGATGAIWNHALPSSTFTQNNAGNTGTRTQYGKTLLCLGCHDGVTAVGSFNIVNPAITITSGLEGKRIQEFSWSKTVGGVKVNNLGTDLTSTHPVGVLYPQLSGSDSASFHAASSGKIGGVLRLQKGAGSASDTVGCGTCHTPHDNTKGYFLNVDNTGSALCYTCHIK